jgi:hypothetical protein
MTVYKGATLKPHLKFSFVIVSLLVSAFIFRSHWSLVFSLELKTMINKTYL